MSLEYRIMIHLKQVWDELDQAQIKPGLALLQLNYIKLMVKSYCSAFSNLQPSWHLALDTPDTTPDTLVLKSALYDT